LAGACGLGLIAICAAVPAEQHIELNDSALVYAQQLIDRGDFTADQRNAWGTHHPSPQEENEVIRTRGVARIRKMAPRH
jgi:hypothetical protein